MTRPTGKFAITLAFALAAIILGVYQLSVFEGSHNVFIGVLWLIYGIGSLLSLPKITESEQNQSKE